MGLLQEKIPWPAFFSPAGVPYKGHQSLPSKKVGPYLYGGGDKKSHMAAVWDSRRKTKSLAHAFFSYRNPAQGQYGILSLVSMTSLELKVGTENHSEKIPPTCFPSSCYNINFPICSSLQGWPCQSKRRAGGSKYPSTVLLEPLRASSHACLMLVISLS